MSAGTVLVDGSVISAVTVHNGGTLGGHGTVGSVTVESGGTFAPGNSPGTIHVADLTLDPGAHFQEQLGGTVVGTDYDQTIVSNSVSLGGATLDLSSYNNFTPSDGDVFTIIVNDGSGACPEHSTGWAKAGSSSSTASIWW